MSDDAKRTILARRARFVAAALAGVGIAAACRSGGQGDQPPEVCLSMPQPETELTPDAGGEPAQHEVEEDAGPPPQPCLSPEPPPQVCLSQPAPEKPFAEPPPDES